MVLLLQSNSYTFKSDHPKKDTSIFSEFDAVTFAREQFMLSLEGHGVL